MYITVYDSEAMDMVSIAEKGSRRPVASQVRSHTAAAWCRGTQTVPQQARSRIMRELCARRAHVQRCLRPPAQYARLRCIVEVATIVCGVGIRGARSAVWRRSGIGCRRAPRAQLSAAGRWALVTRDFRCCSGHPVRDGCCGGA